MKLIIKLQLGRVGKRLMENHGATFSYDENVINEIGSRCKEVESGARNVDSILTKTVLPDLSGEFLSRMAEGGTISKVHVRVGEEGKFAYDIS
jgi:type VI secretion system protein VasG